MVSFWPHQVVHIGLREVGPCKSSQGTPFSDFFFVWNTVRDDTQRFPDNEVRKGELSMQLKKLRRTQDEIQWPIHNNDLPVMSWDNCTSINFFAVARRLDTAQSRKSRKDVPWFSSQVLFTTFPTLSMTIQVVIRCWAEWLARMPRQPFLAAFMATRTQRTMYVTSIIMDIFQR